MATAKNGVRRGDSQTPSQLNKLEVTSTARLDTGMPELNNILGGGIVPGSVILLSGDPGIGKSTLILQVALNIASQAPVLYVSGEETAQQIKIRGDRLGNSPDNLEILSTFEADETASLIESGRYHFILVDSIQTLAHSDISGAPGSVSQITAVTHSLRKAAKSGSCAVLIVGHVTKEGALAGPRLLEHLVDVVMHLEGDRSGGFKLLRGVKNRFGSTNEVAIYEMTTKGLSTIENPSERMLAERQPQPGSVVLPLLTGNRPILVEVQALVAPSNFGYPKRTATGVDLNRLNLLLAVLQRSAGVNLSSHDVYINVVGGFKTAEPASDLAVVMAVLSAFYEKPLSGDTVVFGEVGLNGDIRSVTQPARRLSEAKKLGYKTAISPGVSHGTGVKTLRQASQLVFGDKPKVAKSELPKSS